MIPESFLKNRMIALAVQGNSKSGLKKCPLQDWLKAHRKKQRLLNNSKIITKAMRTNK